ncbi:hypothetical protein Btru_000117 [Bulinus truncatus]|nr:hypothetical protein Btru_000117 [Bulinus truncatus]
MPRKSLKHAISLPTLHLLNNVYGASKNNLQTSTKCHETPFSIKLNQLHEQSKTKSRDELLKTLNSGAVTSQENSKCEFFIKQKKVQKKISLENSTFQKSMKKNKRSPNFINNLWKRIRPTQPLIFGQPLSSICDENNNPPEAIIKLMVLIYQFGPNIHGILRRGNNKTMGKEIREKIDTGVKFELEEHHTPTAASVFKEFIRCIPDGLLLNELHNEWVQIKISAPENDKIRQIKIILDKLPPAHFTLIKLTICLLQHLAKHSSLTQMGPSNLATCIAPSFCCQDASDGHKGKNKTELLKKSAFEIINIFTPLITFMIIKHVEIFGEDVLNMFEQFGCQQSMIAVISEEKGVILPSQQEEEDILEEESFEEESKIKLKQRRDNFPDSNSGTDSDSLHSVLSLPTDTHVGMHQDTSSIDSLVDKEDFSNEIESSPVPVKSHLSPTNLSRDSGLTLSDTQLYDDDVGMEFSNSSKLSHSPVLNQRLDYSFTPRRYKNFREKESRPMEPLNFTGRYVKISASELKDNNEKDSCKEAHSLPVDLDLSLKHTVQHRIIAQSSVDESVSPVSTHASVFSMSEEGSVHSAPQTPNDFGTRSLDWQVNNNDINQTQMSPLYFHLSHFSKSEVNLKTHSDQNFNQNSNVLKKDYAKLKRSWKSHEAEEITTTRKYQPRLVLPPRELSFDQPSPTSPMPPLAEQQTPPHKRNILIDHIKGSPPPNVILQSFNKNLNVDKSKAQKKIIMGSKSVDNVASNVVQAAVQKAKRKIEITPPEKSLHLQQASPRNVLSSCKEPLDITIYEREKQKEISARAKAVYEESLQKYNNERVDNGDFLFYKKDSSSSSTNNDVAFMSSFKREETAVISDSPKKGNTKGSPKLVPLSLEKQSGITCDSSQQCCDTSHANSEIVNSNVKSPKELYLETIKENEIKTHSHQPSKLHSNTSFHSTKSVPFKNIFKAGGNDLHRSYSDANDVRLKIQSVNATKDKNQEINKQDINTVKEQTKDKEIVSPLFTEITSSEMESDLGSKVELHEKFLKAKKFFNQTADSQRTKKGPQTNSTNLHKASSVLSLHSSVVNDRLLSNSSSLIFPTHSKTENSLAANTFQSVEDPLLKSKFKTVDTLLPAARHKSLSTNELSIKSNATVLSKPELPWSVKNLKSQWDKEGFNSSMSKNSNVLKPRDYHQHPASNSSSHQNINLISSPTRVDIDYKRKQSSVQYGGSNLLDEKNYSLLVRKSEKKINSDTS